MSAEGPATTKDLLGTVDLVAQDWFGHGIESRKGLALMGFREADRYGGIGFYRWRVLGVAVILIDPQVKVESS